MPTVAKKSSPNTPSVINPLSRKILLVSAFLAHHPPAARASLPRSVALAAHRVRVGNLGALPVRSERAVLHPVDFIVGRVALRDVLEGGGTVGDLDHAGDAGDVVVGAEGGEGGGEEGEEGEGEEGGSVHCGLM